MPRLRANRPNFVELPRGRRGPWARGDASGPPRRGPPLARRGRPGPEKSSRGRRAAVHLPPTTECLAGSVKKNTHRQGTGGGSPKADLTPAEDMALELNKGRPVLEGIPGGKETSIGSSQDATRFIQVSGSTVFLLEPPAQAPDDADPGESPSATAHDGDDDEEETISLDSRRHEDPDAIQWENQPGNIVRINKRTPHPAKFQLR
ncbi:unnamed protein product [Leuciscus chuanchicus]